MSEMVLVELPDGDWAAVRVPGNVSVSDFRDKIENEADMITRGAVKVMTLAGLKKLAKG